MAKTKPDDTLERIYDELVAKHRAITVTDKSICRQVAHLLAGDMSAPDVSALNALVALLPPPQSQPAAQPWDLTKLTGSQLNALERLNDICCGRAPERTPHRPKTFAYWNAVDAARIADAVAARGPCADLTADEKNALENCLMVILSCVNTTPRGLWSEHLEALTPAPAWQNDLPEHSPDPPKPVAENVVPMRSPSNGGTWPDPLVAGGVSPALFDASDPSGRRRGMP